MANFNNLPNEVIKQILILLSERNHVSSIRFVNRRFYQISQDIYPPTISLQELSIEALSRLSEHVEVDPLFPLKIKHVTLINNISYNEEGLLVTELDLLFEALMNVTEVELNYIYKNNQFQAVLLMVY